MKSPLDYEVVRYVGPAAISAVINNAIFIYGDAIGFNYLFLMLVSWFVGGSVAYLLHARVTFRMACRWADYRQFMVGVALGVPAALACLALFKSVLNLPMVAAAPAATLTMVVYHFLNARLAIRRPWRRRAGPGETRPTE